MFLVQRPFFLPSLMKEFLLVDRHRTFKVGRWTLGRSEAAEAAVGCGFPWPTGGKKFVGSLGGVKKVGISLVKT